MNGLARHLTEAASHGHLPFHPACPTCREERLAGAPLPARPVVSPRSQAGLAAAVLAISAVAPAAAIAQSPPAPETETGDGDAVEPDAALDPGAASGDDAPLGDEDALGTAPDDGQADAGAPEPEVEEDVEEGPAAGEADAQAEAQAPPPAAGAPAPAPAEAKPKQAKPRKPERKPTAEHRAAAPASPTAPASPPAPASQVPVATPAEGARYRFVQPGESLWSIAEDVLGAGASNAEIAREVQRIWALNAGEIGTGDPNLVMAGQKLRLR